MGEPSFKKIAVPIMLRLTALKPNPLAGFGRVGCGVLLVGKAPTVAGRALYRALARSANSNKICTKKVFARAERELAGLFSLHKKKKIDFAGKSIFF